MTINPSRRRSWGNLIRLLSNEPSFCNLLLTIRKNARLRHWLSFSDPKAMCIYPKYVANHLPEPAIITNHSALNALSIHQVYEIIRSSSVLCDTLRYLTLSIAPFYSNNSSSAALLSLECGFLPSCVPSIVINQFVPPFPRRSNAVVAVMTLGTRWLHSAVSAFYLYVNKCIISYRDPSCVKKQVRVYPVMYKCIRLCVLSKIAKRKPCYPVPGEESYSWLPG